jgi:hypothetical protein
MSNSTVRCSAHLKLPTYWWTRSAASVKLLLLSLFLIPSTIVKSQTIHWSQSSNKNNTQGTVVWIGSIVQSSNSTFYEGQSTLQRLFLVDIPTDPSGHYKLTFKHLATKGSINAYDFVTGWYNTGGSLNGKAITTSNAIDPNCYLTINNCSETGQQNDPINMICSTLDGAPLNYSNAVPSSSYAGPGGAPAISSNGNVKGRIDDWDANFSPTGSNGRRITIQSNATISNVNLAMIGYDAGNDQYAQYELSWTGPTAPGFFSILVKIGGHIADQQFYGIGKGASNIDGGPYHFKVSNLYLGDAPYDSQHTISLGDRDNQLKGADILIPPPPCDITPQSQSICVGGTSQQYCGPAGMAVYAWSISPAGATLSATNTQCVTVTSNTPGTYTLTLVTTNSGVQSTATCNATLIVNPNPTANAGPDDTKCQGEGGNTSFTLAGSVTNGTHSWAQIGATGTANSNIAGNTALNGNITVTGIGTVTLRLTSTSNATPSCGTATNDVVLTVNANPTSAAGDDQTLCQTKPNGPTVFNISGTVGNGTGVWSKVGATGTADVSFGNVNNAATTASVSGIGTVTIRFTVTSNATPSCGTDEDDLVLTVNPNPTANAGDDQAACQTKPSGPTVFNISGSGMNGTGVWSKFASTGTADVSFGNVNDAATTASVSGVGTVTIRYTVTSANCGTATDDADLTVNPNPVISCSATPTLIDIKSAAHNSQLNVDLSANADTDPTHYTYAWTEDGAGSFNFSDIKNPVYTAGVSDGGQVISFTVTVTHIATGCSTTTECSLTVSAAGSCPAVPTSAICNGTTTTFTADRAPATGETWVWSANNGASINSPNGQQSVSVTAGNQGFTLKLTISFDNTELSPIECPYEVTVSACAGSCTYTQGKYGNTSPACDADGTDGTPITYPTVLDMIKALLGVGGVADPLIVGSNGKFVTIPATASGATLLHASMPGGSTPRELFGSCTVDNVPSLPACWTAGTNTLATYINKQGKINNVLLSQTITLGLNKRVSSGLAGFVLQAGTFATAKRDGNCGSTVPVQRVCYYDPILLTWVVQNEYTFKTIPQSVIDALNCKQYALNVGGLYQLANDALGNVDGAVGTECNASLSDINNAVAAINEGFDECRIFIGWNEAPCGTQQSRIDITASGIINNNGVTTEGLSVSAYPNPFRDQVNFVIASPVSGKASLEVYNLFGQKLQTVYEGFIYAGRSQVVQLRTASVSSGVLIYKFRINDKQVTGRLISIRE